jgi:dUTP pyrophosphatase
MLVFYILQNIKYIMKLLIKQMSETAKLPIYGTPGSAGVDLCSDEDCIIKPGERKCISTGIAIEWVQNNKDDDKPENFYMRLAARSGLSLKQNIDIAAGVCDSSYRGQIGVILINNGRCNFIVLKGDRIAQAILTKIEVFSEILFTNDLSTSDRGNGGFGSTGTN